MRAIYAVMALMLAGSAFADTLTLRSGRVVNGTYLGGTARQIRMDMGDRIESFDTSEVSSLQFQAPASAPAPAAQPAPSASSSSTTLQQREANVLRPDPAPAPAAAPSRSGQVTLPEGTMFTVRMIDAVDSDKNQVGDTFQASLDEPVTVNGETVIPRGADVQVKLVDDKRSGKLTGKTELTLDLLSVTVDGKAIDVNTQAVTQASGSRTAKTAKVAGGTAALGAIIGALAGGGKGAAIGAVAGGGAGAAAQVITKGEKVKIPSESRLTFTLQNPVRIS
jgi:hypothetical protein